MMRAQTQPGGSRLSYRTLAGELVERNHVQLSWIAVSAIVTIVAIAILARHVQPEVAAAQETLLVKSNIAVSVFLSLLIVLAERSGRLNPYVLLRAGLVYEVAIAASISIFENSMAWRPDELVRGTSSITVWLLAYAMLVPAPPLAAAIYSFAAAAMGPLGHYVLSATLDFPVAPTNRLLIHYGPCFLVSAVAALVNLRVLRLEWAASQAREMGAYDLEEVIDDDGGMGVVWRARHRLLKREAAVKVIRPEMLIRPIREAENLRRRFEIEAKATASLRSPHTVALYDFGSNDEGGFFYAMELLEGFDLERLVKEHGPLPPSRVIHILRQACLSLEEAHRHQMVHRDIKPRNLFLCRLGTSYDFCKVLDFGLVKQVRTEDAQTMTAEGVVVGTFAFMPPEMAMAVSDLDGRTDLYGLGCVAYWLLTGQLVFDEPSNAAMIVAHAQKQPVPPSKRIQTRLPEDLEKVVLACLAKDPGKRPPSAVALSQMLASCSGIPIWTPDNAEHWWQSHPPAPSHRRSPPPKDRTVTAPPISPTDSPLQPPHRAGAPLR